MVLRSGPLWGYSENSNLVVYILDYQHLSVPLFHSSADLGTSLSHSHVYTLIHNDYNYHLPDQPSLTVETNNDYIDSAQVTEVAKGKTAAGVRFKFEYGGVRSSTNLRASSSEEDVSVAR